MSPVFPWHQAILATAKPTAATLLTGEAGCGVDELALALATVYNGGQCDNDPDVLIITPEKSIIPVDAVRHIIRFFSLAAVVQARRTVVILRADSLNTSAANMLLKVLEEPQPRQSIILSARSAQRLPSTIVSRCHLIKTRRPSRVEAQQWLTAAGKSMDSLPYCGDHPLSAADMPLKWPETVATLLQQGHALNVATAATTLIKDAPNDNFDWLDGLQKWIADGIRVAAALPARYFPNDEIILRQLTQNKTHRWLDFYRSLLERRALAAHPLARELLVKETLYAYRQLCLD